MLKFKRVRGQAGVALKKRLGDRKQYIDLVERFVHGFATSEGTSQLLVRLSRNNGWK